MCARLLSCPLCSQPGFVTLDALRAGLVSVATRPLACPVCNETLLGIDKLTIHLFGHTINTSHRCDTRKATEIERTRDGFRDDATLGQPTWNTTNADTALLCERTRTEETSSEKIAFVPLSSLNSVRSVAAIVVNKSLDSTSSCDSPIFATISAESTEKSQNQLIFVPNLSQRQFCSSGLIRTNDRSSASEAIQGTYEASIPIVFHGSPKSKSSSVVVSSRCGEHSERIGALCDAGAYRGDTFRQNSSVADQKEASVDHFSETWIENLLQENGENCSKPGEESSPGKEKSYPSEDPPGLSSGEEKYCKYRGAALIGGESTNSEERQFPSQDSSARGNEETSNGHARSNLNSVGASPRSKTLKVLATKDKTERCNICGIPVPDRNILILHKQVVHMIDEKDVNSMPEELLKNYPCHFCTKIFKNRGSLMVHMRIAHIGYNLALDAGSLSKDKDGELPCCESGYNCPTCGKNFKKEQHVAQHLKTHEGKQWECDVCSKMFTTKYFLKKHKRLHSGEMPYKCTLCDKTFTFQQSYHKHRLYHKDDKPHACVTCGRSFKELSTLHNHERIHTGEKPFVCETCGKCFRQRVSYLVHRRIHTGVMPYKCVACGKNFRYKVSQRTHKCPAQPEDIAGSSDVAATKTAAAASSRNDSSILTDTSIFSRDGGSTAEVSTSENKFILIVNSQGQPILTRESDVRTNYSNEVQSVESLKNQKVSHPSEETRLWNNPSGDDASKQDLVAGSPIANKCDLRSNEKLSTNDANDFFSLVMSPLENDLSSPSTEMEHLRLSSPQNDEARENDPGEICDVDNASNALQNDLSNAIEGIIRNNCSGNDPLETINEESLKQLLYGINRKT